VPLALTAIRSSTSPAGVALTDVLFGRSPPGGGFFAPVPPVTPVAWSLTPAIAGALGLVLVPPAGSRSAAATAYRRGLGAVLLVLAAGADPHRFGLPQLLWPPAVGQAMVVILCLEVGLLLHLAGGLLAALGDRCLMRRRPVLRLWGPPAAAVQLGAVLCVLVGLLVVAPGGPPAGARVQRDDVAAYLRDVRDELPAYRWTVVDASTALPQVEGVGFFVERGQFLDTYDPRRWRFDPRQPQLAVPTSHVLVLVPDNLAPPIRQRIEVWMRDYKAAGHDDLAVEHPYPGLTVYHLYRSPEEEARILEEIRKQEKAGRKTSSEVDD
jgi:hypothetical protein